MKKSEFHYNHETKQGVVFHLVSALEVGKVGVVCIAQSRDEANELYDKVLGELHSFGQTWKAEKLERLRGASLKV
jgi:hypothetical protein